MDGSRPSHRPRSLVQTSTPQKTRWKNSNEDSNGSQMDESQNIQRLRNLNSLEQFTCSTNNQIQTTDLTSFVLQMGFFYCQSLLFNCRTNNSKDIVGLTLHLFSNWRCSYCCEHGDILVPQNQTAVWPCGNQIAIRLFLQRGRPSMTSLIFCFCLTHPMYTTFMF